MYTCFGKDSYISSFLSFFLPTYLHACHTVSSIFFLPLQDKRRLTQEHYEKEYQEVCTAIDTNISGIQHIFCFHSSFKVSLKNINVLLHMPSECFFCIIFFFLVSFNCYSLKVLQRLN